MAELHELTALQQRDAIRRGEVGALELTRHYLARIEQLNPRLGAFVTVTAEAALAHARAADEQQAHGAELPRLHGLPLAFKDLTDVAGVATTHGSSALDHEPARFSHTLVQVLQEAGAVSLGKTQVPEFGLTAYSENRVAAPARNPLDPALSPGGSSGGSAAAVAAGLLPFAPGTDGGGSIRIPAAATGILGLKPGRGRVPAGSPGEHPGALVVAGPLARTAADAGLLLDAMVDEPVARAAWPGEPGFLAAALHAEGRFRIGVSTASPFAAAYPLGLEPEAQAALDAGIRLLAGLGHDVAETNFRYDNRYPQAFHTVWTASLAGLQIPARREAQLMPLTRAFRLRSLRRPPGALEQALAVLARFAEDTRAQYAAYDLVLTPALAQTPRPLGWYTGVDPEADYMRQCQYSPYSSMVNVCGLPAVAVPVHTTAQGLSMGIQLIGRPGAEAQLLAVAAQLEDVR
ncbi:amidase [Arthrobacter mobilis]|uniref:Amidase n=1 Tax=Arthrobacter mobilis TaxID=2724944 RepID=A0A7X6HEW1_9MICC|nr:amidase [Arthrobacter mobilis]NKX55110.1 amidase [Arthrobacter mobilis]